MPQHGFGGAPPLQAAEPLAAGVDPAPELGGQGAVVLAVDLAPERRAPQRAGARLKAKETSASNRPSSSGTRMRRSRGARCSIPGECLIILLAE